MIWLKGVIDEDMIKEHDYCLRCGRKLKSPDARKIGYGVICLKKLDVVNKKKPLFNTIQTS